MIKKPLNPSTSKELKRDDLMLFIVDKSTDSGRIYNASLLKLDIDTSGDFRKETSGPRNILPTWNIQRISHRQLSRLDLLRISLINQKKIEGGAIETISFRKIGTVGQSKNMGP